LSNSPPPLLVVSDAAPKDAAPVSAIATGGTFWVDTTDGAVGYGEGVFLDKATRDEEAMSIARPTREKTMVRGWHRQAAPLPARSPRRRCPTFFAMVKRSTTWEQEMIEKINK